MKVIFKSFYLFFLGVLADSHKKVFDRAVDSCLARGGDISSPRLTRMSDRSYSLYMRFRSLEQDIRREMSIRAL